MNTRQIAAEYRLSHWAEILRDRQESGLSIKAYCKQAGFHENIYFYWQRKLRAAAYEQLAEAKNSSQPTNLTAKGFTEIKLTTQTEKLLLTETTMSSETTGLPEPIKHHATPEALKTAVPTEAVDPGEIHIEIAACRITASTTYPPAQLAILIKEVMASC